MALFSDGGPAVMADLRRYESSAESVARDEQIDLDAKLAVAAEEVGMETFSFLLMSATPLTETARRQTGLADVVVTEPMRRWHAVRTLAGLYRDAFGSSVNDRYRRKWEEYEKLAKDAAEYCFTTGIGLSRVPVPKAPLPLVAETAIVPDRADRTIRINWVQADGAEGAASDALEYSLAPGDEILAPGSVPAGVTGWNVYIGVSGGAVTRQNPSPLGLNVAWAVAYGLEEGTAATDGPAPDYLVVERRILRRG